MKKYLFNKILVKGEEIEFVPYREATLVESFMAKTHSSFEKDEWLFVPTSFKDFLKMLSKTRLNDNNEYNIVVPLHLNCEEPISFENMLKSFVEDVYKDISPNKNAIIAFYKKAYMVKKTAQQDREVLDIEPEEFSK